VEVNTRKPSSSPFLRYFVSSFSTQLSPTGAPPEKFMISPLNKLPRKFVGPTHNMFSELR
jgi:hypothetical protein